MSRLRTWSLVVLTASVVGLAGCSSSSANSSASSTTTPHSTATTSAPAAIVAVQDPSPAGTSGTQPTVTVPSGPPPTQLESSDLIVGTGPAAKPGDKVTVQYVLATYSADKVIQSSWGSEPFSFTLDAPDSVIAGWNKGVVGMQVGGRRELIIPPALGYGDQVPGPGITANDTLVFVIDLLKII
jgi:peptidylprolyl isomerase